MADLCGLLLYTVELSALIHLNCQQVEPDTSPALTPREQTVLTLMSHNDTTDMIAASLAISIATVRKHQQGLYRKLGVQDKHEALFAAYRNGLFSPLEGLMPQSS